MLTYRRHSKPALGPLGDSLDDMDTGQAMNNTAAPLSAGAVV